MAYLITSNDSDYRNDIKTLFTYRSLVIALVRREIQSDWSSQGLPWLWPIFRPLIMLYIIAGIRGISYSSHDLSVPYAAYLYIGLVLWFFFVELTTSLSCSLSSNAAISKKVHLPHMVLIVSRICFSLYQLLLALPAVFIVIFFSSASIKTTWALSFFVIPLVVISALTIGLLFSILDFVSKDWTKVLGYILYIGLLISTVIIPLRVLPRLAKPLVLINPITPALELIRMSVFKGYDTIGLDTLLFLSFLWVCLFISVYTGFKKLESLISDLI